MPLFEEDDYDDARKADGTPEGMVDITYNLTVERKLIDSLISSIDAPIQSPWMYCSLDELPTVLGVQPPVDDSDDLYTALVLGGLAITTTLMRAIHEESVPGLLSHLALLHDQIDAQQGDEMNIIESRYLLSQLVEFCEPVDPIDASLAMMRVIDSVYDGDGEVLPEKALATCKYLMCIALTVLHGDDADCTLELIKFLEEIYAEQAAEPVVPYFVELEDTEDGQ
jgi:hypothetical protein